MGQKVMVVGIREGVDCPEGEYEPPYIFCRTEDEAIWDCADEEEESAVPEDVAEDGDIK